MTDDRGPLDLTRLIDEMEIRIKSLEKTLETTLEENTNIRILFEKEKQLRLEREKQLNEWKNKYLDG